jgi:hypothetical protein
MTLLKHGTFANNKTAGGVGHLLWYYNKYDTNFGFKINGEEYDSVTNTCKHCGKSFPVYKYGGCRWTKIKFCSRDCCWLHHYGRPFLEGEENKKKIRKEAYEKHYWKSKKKSVKRSPEELRVYHNEQSKKYYQNHKEEIKERKKLKTEGG